MTQTQVMGHLVEKIGISKKEAKLTLDELNALVVRELKKEGSIAGGEIAGRCADRHSGRDKTLNQVEMSGSAPEVGRDYHPYDAPDASVDRFRRCPSALPQTRTGHNTGFLFRHIRLA